MSDKLKPNYYKGQDGQDLFDRFSNGLINEEEYKGFCKGNAIKYITRYENKNGIEDLNKAEVYINELKKIQNKSITSFVSNGSNNFNSKTDELLYDFDKKFNSYDNPNDVRCHILLGYIRLKALNDVIDLSVDELIELIKDTRLSYHSGKLNHKLMSIDSGTSNTIIRTIENIKHKYISINI